MKTPLTLPAARQFALMAIAGCASISGAIAAQNIYYNFESVTDVTMDPVLNLAPGATQDGTFVNTDRLGLLEGEEVTVNSVRYLLGKAIQFNNFDEETDIAGHVDTGLNLNDWGMANNLVMNRNFTAMAWVKFGSTAGDNMVFGQLANGIHLGTRGANLHSGHWGDDIGPDQGVNVPPGTTAWRHVAWVNEGQSQSIYMDGVLVVGPGATGASTGVANNLVIGTFVNNGSFIGNIDEVKVFGDQVLTLAQIQTEMTNTLTVVPLATVSSAKLDNVGFTFTVQDFVPNSIVNPATVELEIDGNAVTPTSSTKSGEITTVTYALPALFAPGSLHDWILRAKDQTNPATPNITSTGSLRAPVLPPSVPGPAGTVGTWGVREFRSAQAIGSVLQAIEEVAALEEVDPDPSTNTIFDGSAPVMNHVDPAGAGDKGNFNNDLPFIGGVEGVPEDNIVFVGKTQVTVPAPGQYTFSVHSDDGFAMRVSGGPGGNTSRFLSSNRASDTAGIDPSDPQTIYFSPGSADTYTTGVYDFTAAGTYDILFVITEQTGGAFYEVAWAPGSFNWDYQSSAWTLVGSPNDPSVTAVPFTSRFPDELPGPLGGENTWGIRTFLNATTGSTVATSNWLRDNGALREVDDVETFDVQRNYLNASDDAGNNGFITPDDAIPGDIVANDNVATVAKGRVLVTTPGLYTFSARGDDGFMLRIKGTNGAPNPEFIRLTHPNAALGDPRLEMSNRNVMWYTAGTGDTNTRGIINLPAGEYDLEYFQWEGSGGFWYELAAAQGEFPHGTEPPAGWRLVGLNFVAPSPDGLPQISPAGWTVKSSAPGSLPADQQNLAGALVALAATGTDSNADAVTFNDPQSGGGPGTVVPASPWPNNTPNDDNNFAMQANGQLVVPADGVYHLGFQSDDGGSLTIRGTGGAPDPSFDEFLLENATGLAVLAEENPGSGIFNSLVADVATGNSRTIGRIELTAGTYDLEGVMFEIGGGAYWTILGAIETPDEVVYYPLSKGGNVPSVTMLPLVAAGAPAETFAVTNFTLNPATGAYSITFESTAGANYRIEYTTDMAPGAAGSPQTWNPAPGAPTAGAAGTTTITGNLSGLQAGAGGVLPASAPRVFLRVRRS